jgi:hypothetical protein
MALRKPRRGTHLPRGCSLVVKAHSRTHTQFPVTEYLDGQTLQARLEHGALPRRTRFALVDHTRQV